MIKEEYVHSDIEPILNYESTKSTNIIYYIRKSTPYLFEWSRIAAFIAMLTLTSIVLFWGDKMQCLPLYSKILLLLIAIFLAVLMVFIIKDVESQQLKLLENERVPLKTRLETTTV